MVKLFKTEINPRSILAPEGFVPTWREDMTDEQYHADKTAVGSSSLRKAKKSLLSFAGAMWLRSEAETEAMRMGKIIHLATLEGSKFIERYVVEPHFTGFTKDGKVTDSRNATDVKEKYAKWQKDLPKDAIVVTEEERETIRCMADSVLSHPTASQVLTNVKTEIAGYARDPKTGILVKIKPDVLAFTSEILADLKTCRDSHWFEFRRTVESKKYYFQDSMYADVTQQITGIKPEHRVWIAVENQFPFETRVHEVCPIYKEAGSAEYRHCLDLVKQGIDNNDFPGGQLDPELTQPSVWFEKEHGEMY